MYTPVVNILLYCLISLAFAFAEFQGGILTLIYRTSLWFKKETVLYTAYGSAIYGVQIKQVCTPNLIGRLLIIIFAWVPLADLVSNHDSGPLSATVKYDFVGRSGITVDIVWTNGLMWTGIDDGCCEAVAEFYDDNNLRLCLLATHQVNRGQDFIQLCCCDF